MCQLAAINTNATLFVQMLGVKYLKRAIKAEKVLFAQIAGHKSQELVAQLEIDLNNQQGKLAHFLGAGIKRLLICSFIEKYTTKARAEAERYHELPLPWTSSCGTIFR